MFYITLHYTERCSIRHNSMESAITRKSVMNVLETAEDPRDSTYNTDMLYKK